MLLLGLALRLAMLRGATLGYDELQSVTHAARGIPTGLLSAFLHDPHPPLYYALLAPWLRVGTSDAVILLLSVLIGVLAIAALHRVARLRDGSAVALLAALVFALDPLALHWAAHARMYALVMLLSVVAWHLASRLAEGSTHRAHFAGAVVAELLLLYSHVAAPFFLACILAAGVPELVRHRQAIRRWLAAQALVALAGLPVLFFAATTAQEHMRRPDLAELVRALALFTTGIEPEPEWLVPAGAAAFAWVAACLVLRRRDRPFAVALLVAPFALAALVSYGIRPVWYASRLFAFVTPFFALAVARLLLAPTEDARRWIDRGAAATALALVALGCALGVRSPEREERFADAVALVREHVLEDDLVVVPTLKDKWALAWYATGPAWARGAVQLGGLETLARVVRGEERRELLAALAGYGRNADGAPLRIAPIDGLDGIERAHAGRVWIVARSVGAADATGERLGARTLESFAVPGLVVRLLDSPARVPPRVDADP